MGRRKAVSAPLVPAASREGWLAGTLLADWLSETLRFPFATDFPLISG